MAAHVSPNQKRLAGSRTPHEGSVRSCSLAPLNEIDAGNVHRWTFNVARESQRVPLQASNELADTASVATITSGYSHQVMTPASTVIGDDPVPLPAFGADLDCFYEELTEKRLETAQVLVKEHRHETALGLLTHLLARLERSNPTSFSIEADTLASETAEKTKEVATHNEDTSTSTLARTILLTAECLLTVRPATREAEPLLRKLLTHQLSLKHAASASHLLAATLLGHSPADSAEALKWAEAAVALRGRELGGGSGGGSEVQPTTMMPSIFLAWVACILTDKSDQHVWAVQLEEERAGPWTPKDTMRGLEEWRKILQRREAGEEAAQIAERLERIHEAGLWADEHERRNRSAVLMGLAIVFGFVAFMIAVLRHAWV